MLGFVLTSTLLLSNAFSAEPADYWAGPMDAPVPATLRGARVVHVAGLAKLLARDHPVIVDVSEAPRRPPQLAPGAPWLPPPHRALPGALWIPGAGAAALPPELNDFYRDRLAYAVADSQTPLVVYCHRRCWLSWNAAKRAVSYGYRRVYWFPDGIEGWTAAGQRTFIAVPQTPPASAPTVQALPSMVVLDLELSGDLGGPAFTAQHEQRLKNETARLKLDLEGTGLFRIMDSGPASATIDRLRSQQEYLHDCNGCDLDVGRELNADLVLVAWVDRVSGLILSLTYEIHDVRTAQITARKSFDFRGDNDIAWNHAIDYMVRDLKAMLAAPTSP